MPINILTHFKEQKKMCSIKDDQDRDYTFKIFDGDQIDLNRMATFPSENGTRKAIMEFNDQVCDLFNFGLSSYIGNKSKIERYAPYSFDSNSVFNDMKKNLWGITNNKAWFLVKLKRRKNVNSITPLNDKSVNGSVLPTPTSSSSIVTFFNNTISAECKMIVPVKPGKGSGMSTRQAFVLLEFNTRKINWIF